MNITRDWIKNKAANPAVFSRAQVFYEKNAKISYYMTYDTQDQSSIFSDVMEDGSTYHVQIKLDLTTEKSEETCNCGGFHSRFGACKHTIVTFLKVYDDQIRNQLNIRQTENSEESDIIHHLVTAYEAQLIKDEEQGQPSDTIVKLNPKLVPTHNFRPLLEVSIGSHRPYVVRDIYKLTYDLLNENWVNYGKEFQFDHNLNQLDPRSRQLATLIMASVKEYEIYAESSAAPKSSRYLELTPTKLDEFFQIYCHQTIDDLTFVDADPDLQFHLEASDADYELTTNLGSFQWYEGHNYFYLVSKNQFYRCSERFVKKVRPLLEYGAPDASTFQMPIKKTELGKFVSYVLPNIKSFVADDAFTNVLTDFKEVPLSVKFYLEAPTKASLHLRVEFCYANVVLSPTDPLAFAQHPNLLRDIPQEARILARIKGYHFKQLEVGSYELKGEESLYHFLQVGIDTFNQLGEVYATDSVREFKITEPRAFTMGVQLQNNWLQLSFENIDIEASDYQAILAAYRLKKSYFRLKDGSFLNLKDQTMENFAVLMDDLQLQDSDWEENRISIPSYRALHLAQFTKASPDLNVLPHMSYEAMVDAFSNIEETSFTVPPSLQPILRSYQETGYSWLRTLATYRLGGILADDMGLGKTLQVITLLLSEKGQPSLIVTPASLMYNWQREIEKFAPTLKTCIVRGEPRQRQAYIEDIHNHDIIITSYDLIKRDINHYEKQTFRYCILDEAHYIKNHTTQNAKAVKKVRCDVRLALTGTPIENALSDLWSIFDFILPGYLSSYAQFKKRYEVPIVKEEQGSMLKRLHQQVAPFILRRLKTDVLKELPPKIETNLYCEMEDEQQTLYMATLHQMKDNLSRDIKEQGMRQNRMKVLTQLMRLRQLCCHPALYIENYTGESAKFKMCLELVADCIASGHKVLIFSQFTSMLKLLNEGLKTQGIDAFMLTGSTPSEERLKLTEKFNENETPVFLISLKAGGTGLNLTGADVVIHYDPWWNVSAQNQATDRAHRIGQSKTVQVFKLLTKQTIEEKIEELQGRKRDLTEAVIKEGETFINGLNDEELMALFENDVNEVDNHLIDA